MLPSRWRPSRRSSLLLSYSSLTHLSRLSYSSLTPLLLLSFSSLTPLLLLSYSSLTPSGGVHHGGDPGGAAAELSGSA
eukprot:7385071-Pyramimonas_sp.AAC.1